jgi:hypothetical protein
MTEDKFLEFWKNVQWPEIKPVHYRLYYDDAGLPLVYSQEDLPGQYIDITPMQFALQDQSVKVVDEKLVRHQRTAITKLVHRDSGTCCHVNDVAIVVDQPPGQYWKKQQNVVETN